MGKKVLIAFLREKPRWTAPDTVEYDSMGGPDKGVTSVNPDEGVICL